MEKFTTPMMRQYQQIKKQYPDCLLLFRLGDFYELFMDDAKIGAEILDITLTSRSRGKDGRIPMAGVPYHAVEGYLSKLVKAGYKAAICEQVSEPDGFGLVDREVVRVITPGTITSDQVLEQKQNNFLVAITINKQNVALAVVDLSTGEFRVTEWSSDQWLTILSDELVRLNPSEVILDEHLYNQPKILKIIKVNTDINVYPISDWQHQVEKAQQTLLQHFQIRTLAGFGIANCPLAQIVAAGLLNYLMTTQKSQVKHITQITSYSIDDYLELDRSTMINLELFSTIRGFNKKGTLIILLDGTNTNMGGRLLRRWLTKPLINQSEIVNRLNAVEELLKSISQREVLINLLKNTSDIERILSRLSLNSGNARDLKQLQTTLINYLEIKNVLLQFPKQLLTEIENDINPKLSLIIQLLENQILDEPSANVKQGGMIKPGVDTNLDKLRGILGGGKQWMNDFQTHERERTGIQSLKVKYNQVFGYYIEISKTNLHLVPKEYIRKQTLVNAERFITPELTQQEELVLSAEEQINQLEYDIFIVVVNQVMENINMMQKTAQVIAQLDCLINFAQLAEKYNYCKPEIATDGSINITNGRHPMVERLLGDRQFVPNDTTLNNQSDQLLILTGPNMAGKSVYIRQVALISIMAQMGSFVPAESAKLSLMDRVFVRSGASDVIAMGLSTFMVEMMETAHILLHATQDSLVILDEIGRGTSTYDGISIAWAVAEYLVNIKNPQYNNGVRGRQISNIKNKERKTSGPKTLFATHYHELQALADKYPQIKNFQMSVEEHEGEPVFLYKIIPGGASHSYGIAVAKLAGVPTEVLQRAIEVLNSLEERGIKTPQYKMALESIKQLSFIKDEQHPVMKQLKDLEVNTLTPIEALKKLADWKDQL